MDGSPPLYYLLLHGWMAIFGETEAATRALSLVFALVAVPVAYWPATPSSTAAPACWPRSGSPPARS